MMAAMIITHIDAGPIVKASINPATGTPSLISAQFGDTHVQMDITYARDLAARITQALDYLPHTAAKTPDQNGRKSA
jgi:hypothetical protein